MTIGIDLGGQQLATQAQRRIQAREDAHENSTRNATNSFTYTSTGAGDLLVAAPLAFDCQFVVEPIVTTGAVLVRTPDLNLYKYPVAQVGVFRWVKRPQQDPVFDPNLDAGSLNQSVTAGGSPLPQDQPDDVVPMFYTGAYLYVVVRIDRRPNLSAAQTALADKNPPSVTVHHHLSFSGVAMKSLPDAITGLAADPTVTATSTPLGAGATGGST